MAVLKKAARSGSKVASWGGNWAVDLAFVWTSAFLLLIATLLPGYWYLSFIALIPFLWRIVKAGPRAAFWLGFIFGLTFLSIWKLNALSISPFSAALKIILGSVLFAVFGWAASRLKGKWGFNPLLVALLWVGFEFSLIKLGFATGLLEAPFLLSIAPFFKGLSVLFGFLAISFVIVLINSVLILAIEKLVSLAKVRRTTFPVGQRFLNPFPTSGLFAQKVYLVPEGRAPPFPPFFYQLDSCFNKLTLN